MNNKEDHSQKKVNRRKKVLLSFLAFIIFLIISIFVVTQLFLEDFLRRQITRSVHEASGGQYIMVINDLDASFWTGNVEMDSLVLKQDLEVLDQFRKQNPDQNFPQILLVAESARINNLRWINFLITEDLQVGKIELVSPSLKVEGQELTESLRSTNKNFIELLPGIIAGFAQSLRIKELVVDQGKVEYDVKTENGVLSQSADSIFIGITGIQIDTVSERHLLYSEDIAFNLKNYRLKSANNEQTVSIGEISAVVSDSTFQIDNIHFVERIPESRKENADVFVNALKGTGVNFRSFVYGKQIVMDQMIIESPDVMINADNRQKDVSENEKKNKGVNILVPDFLSEILQSFTIRLISIQDGKFNNTIVNADGRITQRANNLFLDIVKVAGNTVDTFNLASPEQIKFSFRNYQLNMTKPKMDLSLTSFNASTFTGSLRIDDIAISLDGKEVKFENTIDHILGEGFKFRTVLDQQKLVFTSMTIQSPDIIMQSLVKEHKKPEQKTKGILPKGLPEEVTTFVKSFEIGKVAVNKAKINYNDVGPGQPVNHQAEEVNIEVARLNTPAPGEPMDFESVNIDIRNYLLKVGRQRFSLAIASSDFSSADSRGRFRDVTVIQDHPPGIEANHYTIKIPSAEASGFQIKKVLKEAEVIAQTLTIPKLDATFTVHLEIGQKPPYSKEMPNEMIRELDFYLRIDRVNIDNASLEHKDATGVVPILMSFENSRARISNITNDRKRMSPTSPAVMQLTTYIMGEGKLDATVKVHLLQTMLNGSYAGTFSGMDATTFNDILALSDLRLESGVINQSTFDVKINDGTASGTVTLLYQNLDLEVVGKEGKKSRIKSILGNIATKESNPRDRGEAPESVEVHVSRNEDDTFFGFMWRGLLEGITKSVTKRRLTPDALREQ